MKNEKQPLRLIVLMKEMKNKVYLVLLLIGTLSLMFGFTCEPSGKPTIDRFVLLYDIVAIADGIQAVEWDVANASSVMLLLKDESGNNVMTESVPSGSNGLHDVSIHDLTTGKYTVVLEAENSEGNTSDSREFLAVGHEGLWYTFTKWVTRPQEGPWYGFDNEVILVSNSQGLDNSDDVISVSERVKFGHIRWNPDPERWADREGCTSPGLNKMAIRQLASTQIYDKGRKYPFPNEKVWSVVGQYSCKVDWSPCNFGVQGATITYDQVVFSLELEAIGF